MVVKAKAKSGVRVGQVWLEVAAKRYVRIEKIESGTAAVVARYAAVGRFSALCESVGVACFRAPRFRLCRDAPAES